MSGRASSSEAKTHFSDCDKMFDRVGALLRVLLRQDHFLNPMSGLRRRCQYLLMSQKNRMTLTALLKAIMAVMFLHSFLKSLGHVLDRHSSVVIRWQSLLSMIVICLAISVGSKSRNLILLGLRGTMDGGGALALAAENLRGTPLRRYWAGTSVIRQRQQGCRCLTLFSTTRKICCVAAVSLRPDMAKLCISFSKASQSPSTR